MTTIELKITGQGYSRGEEVASTRLAALQDAVEEAIKELGLHELSKLRAALKASRLDPDSAQGQSDVLWRLFIDIDGDSASLRTSATAMLASTQRLVLNRDNADEHPDRVWPISIKVM